MGPRRMPALGKLARIEITPTCEQPSFPPCFILAAARLKVLWRFVMSHARSRPKTLSVCETAALGDRRLVSVIRFEHQRFLIGSSPSSVTLLAQLPDEPLSSEIAGAHKHVEQEHNEQQQEPQYGEL